jgi:hypothetical protein
LELIHLIVFKDQQIRKLLWQKKKLMASDFKTILPIRMARRQIEKLASLLLRLRSVPNVRPLQRLTQWRRFRPDLTTTLKNKTN